MNKRLLPIACSLFCHIGISQQTFEIQSLGSNYSTIEINEAIASAELCGFYYLLERRELKFDDGTIVELFGSDELPNLNSSCFIANNGANSSNVWKVTDTGHLIRIIATPISK